MHGAIGHFKALLQRRKARIEKTEGRFDQRKAAYKISGFKTKLNFPEPSKLKLRKIKAKIRSDKRKEHLRDYIFFFSIVFILVVAIYFFMN